MYDNGVWHDTYCIMYMCILWPRGHDIMNMVYMVLCIWCMIHDTVNDTWYVCMILCVWLIIWWKCHLVSISLISLFVSICVILCHFVSFYVIFRHFCSLFTHFLTFIPFSSHFYSLSPPTRTIYDATSCPSGYEGPRYPNSTSQCTFNDVINYVCGPIKFPPSNIPNQGWRFFTAIFMHTGLIQLGIMLILHIWIGIRLEVDLGPIRIGLIYFMGGVMGNLFSAFAMPNNGTRRKRRE